MTSRIVVCPFNERILSHLQGQRLVVKVDNFDGISQAAQIISSSNNNLHCVLIDVKIPLADIPFHQNWKNIPLAFHVPDIGHFPLLADKLSVMRQLNLRVYLPIDREENYTNLRILSSLGIASTVLIVSTILCKFDKGANWVAPFLSDLISNSTPFLTI
jgi:hypothetical protein